MSETNVGMGVFERFLTLWVLLCITTGVLLGLVFGDGLKLLARLQIAHVNIPIAILVWLMIYPMMAQIDFSSLKDVRQNIKGLGLTVAVNWLIKPFSMAFFGWIFFTKVYSAWLEPQLAQEYLAGAILLGAAPCTAMVFVWSYLVGGNPAYTLVQVSVNDLIIIVLYVPIVQLLLGVTDFVIPYSVLIISTFLFVIVPLIAGFLSNRWLVRSRGDAWFTGVFLPKLRPISITALLLTLILLFAFQGEQLMSNPVNILLVAIPLTLQTYIIFFFSWLAGRFLRLNYSICAPAAMIGASNFFELAVAVAIALFGLNSGAALATVVGVLIEVPVMLSLVKLSKIMRF